jgi:hypothetical protein
MSGFTNLILFIPVFIDWRIALMTVAPQLINNPALNGGDFRDFVANSNFSCPGRD